MERLQHLKGKDGSKLSPKEQSEKFHREYRAMCENLKRQMYMLYLENKDDLARLKTTDYGPVGDVLESLSLDWQLIARRCPKQLWEEFQITSDLSW